jgi:hypothetical protein
VPAPARAGSRALAATCSQAKGAASQAKAAAEPLLGAGPGLLAASTSAFHSAAQSGSSAIIASRVYASEHRALAYALGVALTAVALYPALAQLWSMYQLPTAVAWSITWI